MIARFVGGILQGDERDLMWVRRREDFPLIFMAFEVPRPGRGGLPPLGEAHYAIYDPRTGFDWPDAVRYNLKGIFPSTSSVDAEPVGVYEAVSEAR